MKGGRLFGLVSERSNLDALDAAHKARHDAKFVTTLGKPRDNEARDNHLHNERRDNSLFDEARDSHLHHER
jgi:hypothetical protein